MQTGQAKTKKCTKVYQTYGNLIDSPVTSVDNRERAFKAIKRVYPHKNGRGYSYVPSEEYNELMRRNRRNNALLFKRSPEFLDKILPKLHAIQKGN